jgi:apolipoprotein D and lipocalin family protein
MTRSFSAALASAALLAACATAPPAGLAPLALARDVDLARFMGDWYVIAAIPTVFERDAHRPMDSYRLDADGTIATTFRFNAGAFDGPARSYASRGFVIAGSGNAVWGQQYVWPFRADYRIAWLSADYQQVVVAREKRDHVWIMARTPTLARADYDRLVAFAVAQGYDASRLVRMPQTVSDRSDKPS